MNEKDVVGYLLAASLCQFIPSAGSDHFFYAMLAHSFAPTFFFFL